MLHQIIRSKGYVVLFGMDQAIYRLAKHRAEDHRCCQLPREIPSGSFHLKISHSPENLFDVESIGDVKISRIDAAFAPEEWTCVYEQGTAEGYQVSVYFLSGATEAIRDFFERFINKHALSRLIRHPEKLAGLEDDVADPRDEDAVVLGALGNEVRRELDAERREDEEREIDADQD